MTNHVRTCESPGCNARCLAPHTKCSRHRKPPRKPKAPQFHRTPESERRRIERMAATNRERMWRDL